MLTFLTLEIQKLAKLSKLGLSNSVLPIHLFISARLPPRPYLGALAIQESLASLSPELFQKILIERYQGIPQAIIDNPDLMKIFMPIIQNDFKLYEQYPAVLEPFDNKQVPCAITSIGFTGDNTEAVDFLGWEQFTKGDYHHLQLPGGHFEIINHWQPVTDHINQLVGAYL